MSKQQDDFDALVQALKLVKEPIVLQMNVDQAVTLIASLQLSCRHPGNRGHTRKQAETIARAVQDAMAKDSPEVGRILEQGWHEVFDVPREG